MTNYKVVFRSVRAALGRAVLPQKEVGQGGDPWEAILES